MFLKKESFTNRKCNKLDLFEFDTMGSLMLYISISGLSYSFSELEFNH